MDIKDYVKIFNDVLQGRSISAENLLSLVNEYLTDIKYNKINKALELFTMQPNLILNLYPKIQYHFCKKHSIYSIIYNNKILCYYVSD